jgi:hypothetical protein
MKHRGRFQAQGKNLEESVTWAQDEPLKLEDGKKLLEALKEKLIGTDKQIREKAFEDCGLFIKHLHSKGGYSVTDNGKPMKRTFRAKGQERVDLEIQSGEAFL